MNEIRIDRVEQTKQGRMALFCGEEFLFSVDMETYFAENIGVGDTLSADRLEELRRRTELRRAKDKALQYLSLRDHASGELYDKLRLKFEDETAAAAVAAMMELGLLDDEVFARHRAKYLMARNKSRSQVRRHLAEKGIDRLTIEQVMEELYQPEGDGPDPEVDAALRLVCKSYAAKLRAGKRENVLAALSRRGFSLSVAREAVELWQQQENPVEWG